MSSSKKILNYDFSYNTLKYNENQSSLGRKDTEGKWKITRGYFLEQAEEFTGYPTLTIDKASEEESRDKGLTYI